MAYLPQSNVITSNPLQTASGANMEQTSPRRPMFEGEIVQLSASPELYLLKGFLSGEEADHLIKVVDNTLHFRHLHACKCNTNVTVCRRPGRWLQLRVLQSIGHACRSWEWPAIRRCSSQPAAKPLLLTRHLVGQTAASLPHILLAHVAAVMICKAHSSHIDVEMMAICCAAAGTLNHDKVAGCGPHNGCWHILVLTHIHRHLPASQGVGTTVRKSHCEPCKILLCQVCLFCIFCPCACQYPESAEALPRCLFCAC